MSYNNEWKDWFDGGKSIWSEYGYSYHSYLIARYLIKNLDIPKGDILQLGTGIGITIEELCNIFGKKRVFGYDIFNPLQHPNIHILDLTTNLPKNGQLAYTDIEVGSVDSHQDIRYKLFDWAWDYTVKGGYILVNNIIAERYKKAHPLSIQNSEWYPLNKYDIPQLWDNVHKNRLNTKTLIKKT
mgnify:CR=1 FL=1|tara:strand:- start:55 stop:606 length:552 start_codon:yes stop_codon:yes gene_type:complete